MLFPVTIAVSCAWMPLAHPLLEWSVDHRRLIMAHSILRKQGPKATNVVSSRNEPHALNLFLLL